MVGGALPAPLLATLPVELSLLPSGAPPLPTPPSKSTLEVGLGASASA